MLVSQFPRADATVWATATDPKYVLPVGVFTATMYLAEYERTVGDKKYKDVQVRFADLQGVEPV